MRRLRIIEHISLDGVIQNSADGGDFPDSDWTARYRTPAGRDAILAAHGESFDLLLGRRTYDLWSGFWPKAPSSAMADRLNAATKFVSGPAGHREALLRGRNPGTVIRARRHESNAVRRHPQYVQGRRALDWVDIGAGTLEWLAARSGGGLACLQMGDGLGATPLPRPVDRRVAVDLSVDRRPGGEELVDDAESLVDRCRPQCTRTVELRYVVQIVCREIADPGGLDDRLRAGARCDQ